MEEQHLAPKQRLIAVGVQSNVCKKHMDSHLISVFANHEILPSYLMPHRTLALEFWKSTTHEKQAYHPKPFLVMMMMCLQPLKPRNLSITSPLAFTYLHRERNMINAHCLTLNYKTASKQLQNCKKNVRNTPQNKGHLFHY
jgi:hypothetical protein